MDGSGSNDCRSFLGAKTHRPEDQNGKQARRSTYADRLIMFRGAPDVDNDYYALLLLLVFNMSSDNCESLFQILRTTIATHACSMTGVGDAFNFMRAVDCMPSAHATGVAPTSHVDPGVATNG
jgi:hypothetical protein